MVSFELNLCKSRGFPFSSKVSNFSDLLISISDSDNKTSGILPNTTAMLWYRLLVCIKFNKALHNVSGFTAWK